MKSLKYIVLAGALTIALAQAQAQTQGGRVVKNTVKSEICTLSQTIKSRYGLEAMTENICDSMLVSANDHFDLADAASDLSYALMKFRVEMRSQPHFNKGEALVLESYEDQLSELAAKARGGGILGLACETLPALAEIQGIPSNQVDFASACGQE